MKYTLEKYSQEMNCEMALEELIDSHRRLRIANIKNLNEWSSEITKAFAIGEKRGFDHVTNGLYIEVSKLKNMTIAELIEFIGYEKD
jgi:hypothetical protein